MENFSDNEIYQSIDLTHKLSDNNKSCEICYTRMDIASNHTLPREGTRWAHRSPPFYYFSPVKEL